MAGMSALSRQRHKTNRDSYNGPVRPNHDFEQIQEILRTDGSEAGFGLLIQKLVEQKNYPQLFEARLMKKRYELGLPLTQSGVPENLPDDARQVYEKAFIEAAREVGDLFLKEGDIQHAWPYFRALGETGPLAEAINSLEPKEGIDPIIEIAFYERVNPRKGFELILANYGICRAITGLEQYPVREGREECIGMVVRALYSDLVEALKRMISSREATASDTEHLDELMAGREWLFEDNAYHCDTTHLAAILRFSLESTDQETLALAFELAEYGRRLSPMFHYRGDPPFENLYLDHGIYLCALLGRDAEGAIAHFRNKVSQNAPGENDSRPAQVLVGLLARLERHGEAIEISLEHLRDVHPSHLACPSVSQLCELSGDYGRLMSVAREQGDLLTFTAAAIQEAKN